MTLRQGGELLEGGNGGVKAFWRCSGVGLPLLQGLREGSS